MQIVIRVRGTHGILCLGNVLGGVWKKYVLPSKSNATQRNIKIYQLNLKMNVRLPSSLPVLTMVSCSDLGQKQL